MIRIVIAVTGIGAFFLAKEYVTQNRYQAMIVRQNLNYQLEKEIEEIRSKQQEQKEKFRRLKQEAEGRQ
jgi:hypothetical protein